MITSTSSNPKRSPVRLVLKLQGSVPTPAVPLRTAPCNRKRSHPSACSCIKPPMESVVKPDSQEGSVPSVLPTESTLSSSISQAHTSQPGSEKPCSGRAEAADPPTHPIFPVLVPLQLHTCASTIVYMVVWYIRLSNWKCQIYKKENKQTKLCPLGPFYTPAEFWASVWHHGDILKAL